MPGKPSYWGIPYPNRLSVPFDRLNSSSGPVPLLLLLPPMTVVLGAVSTKFAASDELVEDVEVVPVDVVEVPVLVLLVLLEVRVMVPVQSGLTV